MTTYPTWAETPEGRWPQIMEQARMSEMVERVAKAIAKARGGWHADEGQWRSCEDEARAAIEAMREPSMTMEAAGYLSAAFREGTQPCSLDYRPDYIFKAMIDEALK